MARFPDLLEWLETQHGRLFGWVPVCLAVGVGGYFSLRFEPGMGASYAAALLLGLAFFLGIFGPRRLRPLMIGGALIVLGGVLAAARAHWLAAPVLDFRYYGPVEGRLVLIDRSSSDQPRLTLRDVVLERVSPSRTPARVRLTIAEMPAHLTLAPGQKVMLTAFLSAPQGPVEPGGFDFQRMAWFAQLGAVGFSRSPVMLLEAAPRGPTVALAGLRQRISDALRARLPGDVGGFITAITTNDKSGISPEGLQNLRAANLAHLLAISGLHMALLTGFVFTALRGFVALFPYVALRVSSKKIAACIAVGVAALYLGLSGGAVATTRSFVMVAILLIGVLVNRRALSLRSVAWAGVVVLVLRPESLIQAGFQMSFAATVALVWVFETLRHAPAGPLVGWAARTGLMRVLRPVGGLLLSSFVAGLATAPIGAAHFNQVSGYGLLANLLCVPVMGTVIMPAAVVAAVLAPFGWAGPALWVMAQGASWILGVGAMVASWQGAVYAVPAPPAVVLPLLALSCLWGMLIVGPARWGGAVGLALALALWAAHPRPSVLISPSGGLVGVMTADGRSLSRPRGDGFAARSWLENDGDSARQAETQARANWSVEPVGQGLGLRLADVAGIGQILHLTGRAARDLDAPGLTQLCKGGPLIVMNGPSPLSPSFRGGADREIDLERALMAARGSVGCAVIDTGILAKSGAIAITQGRQGLHVQTDHQIRGDRLWSGRP